MPTNPEDLLMPVRVPSYVDFYRTAYGQFITSVRPAGRVGAILLEADQPAGDWSDAATPDMVILQHASGPARVSLNLGAGRFATQAARNDFMVAPMNVATTILVDAPHRILALAIPWDRMRAWADSDALRLPVDGDFGRLHQTVHQDRRLTMTLDALWRQQDGTSAASSLFNDALLLQAVAVLIEVGHPDRGRAITGLSRRDLQRVDAYMRARLAEDIGLDDLASLVGLSVTHFCRAFKRSTGSSPYQALVVLRMQHAQQLLAHTPQSITHVALSCGYAQPAHFAKLFRRATGVAPALWRRLRLN
jgi:AraC family transcriptional regulator